jgi:UDP-galactopyranose mutase
MKKALVIGGGFGGCTAVHQLKSKDWHVTLVHPSDQLGGGVRTRLISGHPVTYGPRHFLTHNESTYSYLSSHVPLRRCQEHQFITYVDEDSQFYSYPIHEDDIPRMPDHQRIFSELSSLEAKFREAKYSLTVGNTSSQSSATDYEDFWKKSIGQTLYQKFIDKYTKKMWMIDDNRVIDDFSWSPKGVAIKRGPREGWDTAISAYPIASDGYNLFFDSAKQKADLFIKGTVSHVEPGTLTASILNHSHSFDLIINTAPLDEIFNSKLGSLEYVGRDIEYVVLPTEYTLPKDVYFAYYAGSEAYTRVVEYKKFTKHSSPNTIISLEYPSRNGKYYPMPVASQRELHQRYKAACHHNFHNVGRIALYNYRYDIDDVIEQVLDVVDSV